MEPGWNGQQTNQTQWPDPLLSFEQDCTATAAWPGIAPDTAGTSASAQGMTPESPVASSAASKTSESIEDPSVLLQKLQDLRKRKKRKSFEPKAACDFCRKKRLACDRADPTCGECQKRKLSCTRNDPLMR